MRISLLLIGALSVICLQQTNGHLPPIFKDGHFNQLGKGREAGGTALAAVISSRKLGLGLKAILLKPLLLVALAKIKLALLVGKPLALLALKKLLLKAVLGKLLLKIPLILFKGKALLVKMLALKFALITKGLIGLKAPLALLFLGACSLGNGLGLALSLGAKFKEHFGGSEEEDYSYEEESYALPAPLLQYGAPPPSHSPYGRPLSYGLPPSGYPAAAPAVPSYHPVAPPSGYYGGRRKRDAEDSEEEEEDEEETIDETPENLRLEFEAARTNGNAYLYMAAQFDEQSCGRRLMCEIYQKPHESLSEDEILLQEIFG